MIKRHNAAVRFHIDADAELMQAVRGYAAVGIELAARFLDDIEHAIGMIAEGPMRWPIHLHGTRRYLLRRFPYGIVYRLADSEVEVIAVAHLHRRPGYWKSR